MFFKGSHSTEPGLSMITLNTYISKKTNLSVWFCMLCIIVINETAQAFSMSNVAGREELWCSRYYSLSWMKGWQKRQRRIVSQREFVKGKPESDREILPLYRALSSHLQRQTPSLRDIWDRPQWLSKQILGFIIYFRMNIEIPFIGVMDGDSGKVKQADWMGNSCTSSQQGTLGHLF